MSTTIDVCLMCFLDSRVLLPWLTMLTMLVSIFTLSSSSTWLLEPRSFDGKNWSRSIKLSLLCSSVSASLLGISDDLSCSVTYTKGPVDSPGFKEVLDFKCIVRRFSWFLAISAFVGGGRGRALVLAHIGMWRSAVNAWKDLLQ